MTNGAGDGMSDSSTLVGDGDGNGVSMMTAGLPLGAVGAWIGVGALVMLDMVGSQVGF